MIPASLQRPLGLLLGFLLLAPGAGAEVTEAECEACARFAAETGLQRNGTFADPCEENPMNPACAGASSPTRRWVDRCAQLGGGSVPACRAELQRKRLRCARVLRSAAYLRYQEERGGAAGAAQAPSGEAGHAPRRLSDVLASLRSRSSNGTVREVQDPVCRAGLEGQGQPVAELWPALGALPRVDAAVRTATPHEVAVFGGDQVVFVDVRTGRANRSGPIAELWPGPFTEDIDAALNWSDRGLGGKVYLFQGGLYARYSLFRGAPTVEVNYPRGIRRAWRGMPGDLDAALFEGGSRAYFFKDAEVIVYDLERSRWERRSVLETFLGGYPTRVQAAVRPHGSEDSFLFRDGRVKRFDHTREDAGCAEN